METRQYYHYPDDVIARWKCLSLPTPRYGGGSADDAEVVSDERG